MHNSSNCIDANWFQAHKPRRCRECVGAFTFRDARVDEISAMIFRWLCQNGAHSTVAHQHQERQRINKIPLRCSGKSGFSSFGLGERDGKMIPENPLSCGAKGNRLEREHHSCTMKPEKSVNFSAEFLIKEKALER